MRREPVFQSAVRHFITVILLVFFMLTDHYKLAYNILQSRTQLRESPSALIPCLNITP